MVLTCWGGGRLPAGFDFGLGALDALDALALELGFLLEIFGTLLAPEGGLGAISCSFVQNRVLLLYAGFKKFSNFVLGEHKKFSLKLHFLRSSKL